MIESSHLDNIKNFDIASTVAIITAFTALITGFYSIFHSRKTIYINAVTTSRLNYIDSLRNNISEFCGLMLQISTSKFDNDKLNEINEKTVLLLFTIKLQLNRKNYFDKKLLEQLDIIYYLPDTKKTEELKIQINQLLNYTQDIISLEWSGIKKEASKGKLWNWQTKKLLKQHKKTYGNEN